MQSPKVLIVGSGPSGLILALSLLKHGVPVRVIEKDLQFHRGTRGPGIVPRTLEIERYLGVVEDLLQYSCPNPYVIRVYDAQDPYKILKRGAMSETFDPTPACPYMSGEAIPQYLHEDVLRKHIEALGGKVDRGVALVNLSQDNEGVSVELSQSTDGETRAVEERYDWVVAADGARSAVRKALNINFLGETRSAERMYIADCKIDGLEETDIQVWGESKEAKGMFRYTGQPKRFQVMFIVPEKELAKLKTQETSKIQEVINGVTERTDIRVVEVTWQGEWRPNIRMADRFQVKRVFIVGDAAHVHSPTGGQGLNSSAMDSFNLGWKLALAVKGLATPALLESYEKERMPVIAEMLKISTELLEKTAEHVWKTRNVSQAVAAAANAERSPSMPADTALDKDSHWFRGRKLFQLDVNYRWSDVIIDERFEGIEKPSTTGAYGTIGQDVRAGDRAPDAPGLTVIQRDGTTVDEATRFFDVFTPDKHTVVIFAPSAELTQSVTDFLQKYPDGLIRTVVVVPGAISTTESFPKVNLVLKDTEGHAFKGYSLPDNASHIVVVRPDGVVGAVVKGPEGLERYFSGILVSASVNV